MHLVAGKHDRATLLYFQVLIRFGWDVHARASLCRLSWQTIVRNIFPHLAIAVCRYLLAHINHGADTTSLRALAL